MQVRKKRNILRTVCQMENIIKTFDDFVNHFLQATLQISMINDLVDKDKIFL